MRLAGLILLICSFAACRPKPIPVNYEPVKRAIMAHQFDSARVQMRAMFRDDSLQNAEYFFLLGMICHQQHNNACCLKHLNTAANLDAMNTDVISGKMTLYAELKFCNESAAMYGLLMRIDSTNSDARLNAGYAHFICGAYKQAITDFSYVCRMKPSETAAQSDLAMSYYYAGDTLQAGRNLRKAILKDSLNIYLYDALGDLYADSDPEQAMTILTKAEHVYREGMSRQTLAHIYYLLSYCYEQKQDISHSREYMDKAIANGYIPDANTE